MTGLTRGRFITFEGGEGAGKSTQVRRLVERLRHIGQEAIATREPGGSARAEALREMLLSGAISDLGPLGEAVLFSAARIDHIDTLIKPALRRNAWVICDRFADSTRAYQGVAGKAPQSLIALLEEVAVGAVKPELTVLMDISPEAGLARAQARAGGAAPDRFEGKALDFHHALREAFLAIAAGAPDRVKIIDATQPADVIEEQIWALVARQFQLAFDWRRREAAS